MRPQLVLRGARMLTHFNKGDVCMYDDPCKHANQHKPIGLHDL